MGKYDLILTTVSKSFLKGSGTSSTTTKALSGKLQAQIQSVCDGFLTGGRVKPLTSDTVQLSLTKFLQPSEAEVKELLARHCITGNTFCQGEVVLSKSFINKNNEIFLRRLDELYPAVKGQKNAQIEYIMCCLEDINHSLFKDKEGFLKQFIKDFNEVKQMTDKSGNCLFDQGVGSLYSMKAILQAKYNSPERYNAILNLYKLAKQGKAPDYILKGLIPEGQFHSLGKADIDKLIQGKNYFEQFKTLSNKSEILKNTQFGDVFSVGDNMYVRTQDAYTHLNMSKSMYEKLFPPIERYCLAQTENSCHFVATLDGMIKNPQTRVRLYEMFEQTGEHTIRVKLPGKDTIPVEFDLRNMDYLNITEGAEGYLKGALGHRMIEHSTGININRIIHNELKSPLLHINNGGKPEAYDIPLLLGKDGVEIVIGNANPKLNLMNKSQGNILTVLKASNDKGDIVNRNIGYTGGHVYSTQRGNIFNPWNTIETLSYPIHECPNPYAVYL